MGAAVCPRVWKALEPVARPVGDSWRVPETYLKIRGQWVYLYRAVDKAGRTVDFLLSRRRDMSAAKRFFSRATKQHGAPRVITLDGYAASHQAVAKLKTSGILPRRGQVRSCKYLNNVIKQDHRRIKQRVRPMLGLVLVQILLSVCFCWANDFCQTSGQDRGPHFRSGDCFSG